MISISWWLSPSFVPRLLEGRQEPGVDQGVEHLSRVRSALCREHRQQLVPLPYRPRPLSGHQVSEQLPHQRSAVRPDPLERRLRVLGQRAATPPISW